MRKALVMGIALLVTSVVVLGGTVFRQPIADAATVLSVFVTNDSSHPVPVREQNLDANGNVKVHEQGTANVNVTNNSLSVAPAAPIIDGGAAHFLGGGQSFSPEAPVTATALAIHMTSDIDDVVLSYQGSNIAAVFLGPLLDGNDNVVLALTRPIKFDRIFCAGPDGQCAVSWVGAQS